MSNDRNEILNNLNSFKSSVDNKHSLWVDNSDVINKLNKNLSSVFNL